MGRRSRQKQHLKQLTAVKPAAVTYPASLSGEEEGSSSMSDVIWSDDELDQQPETTLKKLFHGMSNNTLSSKRPSRYMGNSIRTQKRQRAEAKRQAAKNGRTILNFFSPVVTSISNMSTSNLAASSEDGASDSEHDSMVEQAGYISEPNDIVESSSDSCSEDGGPTNDELIKTLERRLKNGSSEKERWRLAAVLQYLRLLQLEPSKMKASLYVAKQLGRDAYLARRIRGWTAMLRNGQEIPASMRGKHIKVRSLLEEEDIQQKILQYLRSKKFEFYLADFIQHVSNDIFPTLGISRSMPIGYEVFCLLLFQAYFSLISCICVN
jgi:hypothetical protein